MKDKLHIMCDIETLGKKTGATIFQIAAASFDITTGQVFDTYNHIVDINTADLSVDGDTLKWWLKTDKELLTKLLLSGTVTERYLAASFSEFIITQGQRNQKDVTLWGNGIAFDNVKIKHLMDQYYIPYPVHFRNERDVRTILALAVDKSGLTEKEIKQSVTNENDTKHDAIDDVMFQIRLVCKCYDILNQ